MSDCIKHGVPQTAPLGRVLICAQCHREDRELISRLSAVLEEIARERHYGFHHHWSHVRWPGYEYEVCPDPNCVAARTVLSEAQETSSAAR